MAYRWRHCNYFNLAVFFVITNLITLLYIIRLQPSAESRLALCASRTKRKNSAHVDGYDAKLTILVRDFEQDYLENKVAKTLQLYHQSFPNAHLVIVSDKLPYPPIKLSSALKEVVEVIQLDPLPASAYYLSNPDHFIKSEYVMFVPDATRPVSPDMLEIAIERITSEKYDVFVVPTKTARNEQLKPCHNLKVNLREWTMTVSEGKTLRDCNSFDDSPLVILPRSILLNLTRPFARPFPYSLFVQAAMHDLFIGIYDDVLLMREELYSSPAITAWQRDKSKQERKIKFYRQMGIKKVISLPSGDIEWYGCGRDTERCFGNVINAVPEFLYQQRWTPPCCLKALRETAKHVFDILTKNNVPYWLEGGSLLGAARHKDIIPWDYDVDIGIYRDDITKLDLFVDAQKQPTMDEDGFVWEKATDGDFYRVQYSETNRLHVDIFPFYSRNGIMTKDTWFPTHRQDCEFPEHYLKPLTKIQFAGVEASAPNNITQFLELKFGKGVIDNPQYPDTMRT